MPDETPVKIPDNDRQKGDEYAAKQPNKKGAPERPFGLAD